MIITSSHENEQPEDWDDNEYIADPEDKKPAGYDDIPKEIPDAEAKKVCTCFLVLIQNQS